MRRLRSFNVCILLSSVLLERDDNMALDNPSSALLVDASSPAICASQRRNPRRAGASTEPVDSRLRLWKIDDFSTRETLPPNGIEVEEP